MTTRQQRRARARAPIRKKRRGFYAFLVFLISILLAGGAAISVLRANPPPITRGALVGEHWHAKFRIEICGQRLENFPQTQGEIHTHGDGRMHIHPSSESFANKNATLGAFFRSLDSEIGRNKGKDFIALPDTSRYTDSDKCEKGGPAQQLNVYNNGKLYAGDPSLLAAHEGDNVVVRFGPKPKPGTSPRPNPLTAKQSQFQPPAGLEEAILNAPPGGGPAEPSGSAPPGEQPKP